MKFPDVEEVKNDDEETVEVSAMECGREPIGRKMAHRRSRDHLPQPVLVIGG